MSSDEELWDQLAFRVTRSQVGGVRAEDDDILAAADLIETSINPHRGAQAGMAGAASPGMMPPMMMGGAGGAAGGAGGPAGGLGAGGRVADPGAGPLSVPASAPAAAGVPGDATALSRQSGGGGAGGIGGGAGPAPLASGGGPGVEPAAAAEAEPPVERAGEVAGLAMVASETADLGRAVAVAVAVAVAPASEPLDGFEADPAELHWLGERWSELAERVAGLSRHPEAGMGLFKDAERAQHVLSQQLDAWRTGAMDEFEAMAERLHVTAAQYGRADDEGIAELRRTEGLEA
ncbi:hypothetical protein [Tessaracoccus sp. MC1756]|uniref:hypothetical protein n=1 Tax=Tessaracoccus sp. MC1756 TaxID=2760311 RepID=UPI001600AF01|nr:hypothetical protein [Tessaracoccus sp. MC1756]MBB1508395.1 hypothetical protein [Tessaracoccus sp. MC1756]